MGSSKRRRELKKKQHIKLLQEKGLIPATPVLDQTKSNSQPASQPQAQPPASENKSSANGSANQPPVALKSPATSQVTQNPAKKITNPKISAIVLNWNESHVSVETVERLLAENIEVVVIDNGSTDESPEKFKKFGSKIKLVLLNHNYGSSIGRNLGIDMVESDFTMLIDGDILYVPDTIKAYAQILMDYGDCACVGYFDWEHRKKTGWAHGTKDKALADAKMSPITQIGNWYPMAWTQYGLFRTDVLKKYRFISAPPFNEAGYGFEDDWFYREFLAGGWKSFHVDKPFYYHDAHHALKALRKTNEEKVEERKKLFYERWGKGTLSVDIIEMLPKVYLPNSVKQKVDVIMLAYTKDSDMYTMTSEAISSLRASEENFDFNVHLIETNKNFNNEYPKGYDANVIIPQLDFNYNKFLNIGLKECHTYDIVIVNNDVVFAKDWWTNASKVMKKNNLDSASPYWKGWFDMMKTTVPDGEIYEGYEVGKHVFGYCIITNRKTIQKIGDFNEKFEFWYQDNAYAQELKKHGLRHALIKSSVVHHLMSKSHALVEESKREHLTKGMKKVFYNEYHTSVQSE